MKITLIGAGNVATHIAIQLYKSGCCIDQVYSRTIESAQLLAEKVEAKATNDLSCISDTAEYYIFSVKDSILEDIIKHVPHNKGIWIHTAGSMPIEVFSEKTKDFGVIYPLQTFSKNKSIEWSNIPLFIEYSNEQTRKNIEDLSQKLSLKIFPLSTKQRSYIHLSGVFACNFVNHMYELANKTIEKTGLPFDILLPLIHETYSKMNTLTPQEAQTGPAIRFDENIMNKHLHLIKNEDIRNIYRLISLSIHNTHKE